MSFLDKVREFLLLPVSKRELARRLERIRAGEDWPPIPKPCPPPPAPPGCWQPISGQTPPSQPTPPPHPPAR